MLQWIRVLPDLPEGQILEPRTPSLESHERHFLDSTGTALTQAQTHTQNHTITHIFKNNNQSQREKGMDSFYFCCFECFSKNPATMV